MKKLKATDRIVSVILFPVIIENVIPINIKLNHIIFTIY